MKWQNFLAGTRNSSQETPYMAYLVITIDIRKAIGRYPFGNSDLHNWRGTWQESSWHSYVSPCSSLTHKRHSVNNLQSSLAQPKPCERRSTNRPNYAAGSHTAKSSRGRSVVTRLLRLQTLRVLRYFCCGVAPWTAMGETDGCAGMSGRLEYTICFS